MAFYAFRLDRINVITPRSNHLDDDVVTFGVLVNQVDIEHGTATFPSLSSGSMTLLPEVPPRNRKNINQRWECGPYEFSSGDLIGSSLLFMLNQQTRCQDNILLTQKFRKFLKP